VSELDVDRLWEALEGMGVIDNGTWVSFRRQDAENIAAAYAAAGETDLTCVAGPPHESAAMKAACPDCAAGHETHDLEALR
jgi:hypothetical protein